MKTSSPETLRLVAYRLRALAARLEHQADSRSQAKRQGLLARADAIEAPLGED